jgi:hypothetical protein
MTDVRRGIDLARGELESVTVDGLDYWTTGKPAARSTPTAYLLPNYDEFFIGHRDRSAIGRRLDSVKAVTGGNALIANVVVIDGQLVGGWRRTLARDGVRLALTLLTRLTPVERERVAKEVRRYAAFAGREVEVTGLDAARGSRSH